MDNFNGLRTLVIGLKQIAEEMGLKQYAKRPRVSLNELAGLVSGGVRSKLRTGERLVIDGRVVYVYMDAIDKPNRTAHAYACGALTNKDNRNEAQDYVACTDASNDGRFVLRDNSIAHVPLCKNCIKYMAQEEYGSSVYQDEIENKYGNVYRFRYADYAKDHYQKMKYDYRKEAERLKRDLLTF